MVFPSPFFSTVIQWGLIILEGGTEEQKKELLSGIAEGSLIMAVARYEEDGSYRASGIRLAAEESTKGYRLNGTKMFVTDANIADKLIVAANLAGSGVTLFLVETDDPGLSIKKMPTIGMDNTCEVILKDVQVRKDRIIGSPGGGWGLLESMNEKAAVAKAAEMVGGSKACIDITADYAKQREQYGKPIGGFQAIQHDMADMLVAYDTSYNYLYKVAWLIDEGLECAAEASVLKACVNENFKFISERAVQIHGAIGTTREGDVGLFYRRAKSWEYICGDTDLHYEQIMDNLLKEPPA